MVRKVIDLLEEREGVELVSPCESGYEIKVVVEHMDTGRVRIYRGQSEDDKPTDKEIENYLEPNTKFGDPKEISVPFPACRGPGGVPKYSGAADELPIKYELDQSGHEVSVAIQGQETVPGRAFRLDFWVTDTAKSTSDSEPSSTSNSDDNDSSTSNGNQNDANPPGNGGDKTGVIVGGAVGGLIGGLALGFLIAFFLLRKKYARRSRGAPLPVSKSPPESKYSAVAPADTLQLNQFLLDSTPDREIAAELRSLKDLIQQHVENNYHQQPVQANPAALAQVLAELGVGRRGALSPDPVTRLAMNPATRYPAIQHILSEVLFSAIDFRAASSLSMLPPTAAIFATAVPPVELKTGDEEATSLALTKWRALTAFLLHPQRSQRTPLTANESAVAPQMQALASALNQFLEPFVYPDQNGRYQQLSHLQAVVLECTKLGYVVFSQPGEWAFSHRPADGGQNCLVVCAGLQKVRNKDGMGYGGAGKMVERPSLVQL